MIRSLRELWQYRALLWNLTQRELKARYRGSALGFLWTFVNPLLLMSVYALVFGIIQKSTIPNYTYFVFVGSCRGSGSRRRWAPGPAPSVTGETS